MWTTFIITKEITECLCYTVGSLDTSCTDDAGACTCNEGYSGDKCDSCADAWFMINGVCHGKFTLFLLIRNIRVVQNAWSL